MLNKYRYVESYDYSAIYECLTCKGTFAGNSRMNFCCICGIKFEGELVWDEEKRDRKKFGPRDYVWNNQDKSEDKFFQVLMKKSYSNKEFLPEECNDEKWISVHWCDYNPANWSKADIYKNSLRDFRIIQETEELYHMLYRALFDYEVEFKLAYCERHKYPYKAEGCCEHKLADLQREFEEKYILKTEETPTEVDRKIKISEKLDDDKLRAFIEKMQKRKEKLGIKDDDNE